MKIRTALSLMNKGPMLCSATLLGMLLLSGPAVFAGSITFLDNNDVVSYTTSLADLTGPGGTITGSCSGRVCNVNIQPFNAFSGGPYVSWNLTGIGEPAGTLSDTLTESPNGLILVFTADDETAPLTPIPGAFGFTLNDGAAHLLNTVSFGTPGGTISVDIMVQRINDTDAPEPASMLMISGGIGAMLGFRRIRAMVNG